MPPISLGNRYKNSGNKGLNRIGGPFHRYSQQEIHPLNTKRAAKVLIKEPKQHFKEIHTLEDELLSENRTVKT